MGRKIIHILSPALLALLLFASCDKEEQGMEQEIGGEREKIRFEVAVGTATATPSGAETRVTIGPGYTSTFTAGDQIGVFIVKGNGELQSSGNWVDNMAITYNEDGTWSPSEPLYFPTGGDKLHFYAYYPYNASIGDPTTSPLVINIDVPTDQSSKEVFEKSAVLTCILPDVTKTDDYVKLVFSHQLALVELSVTGEPMSGNVVPTLEIRQMSALLSLASGTVAAIPSFSRQSVKMYRVEQEGDPDFLTNYTYRAYVPSQPLFLIAGGDLFKFSRIYSPTVTRSLSYKSKEADRGTLEKGKVYRFNITLNKPSLDPNHEYKVGDYYPHKGFPILGVVFETSNGGKNGKIVDLDFIQRYAPVPGNALAPIRWGDPAVDEHAAGVAGIRDMNDGYNGTRNLIIKRKDQPTFADVYCLFNWIYRTKNNGDVNGMWYLPAVNEMIKLHTQLSSLNTIIESAGGRSLLVNYYSRVLTEENAANAYYVNSGIYRSIYTKSDANWNSVTVVIAKF